MPAASAASMSLILSPNPLFPKSKVAPDHNLEYRAVGLDRAHWANANPVRAMFRETCSLAGLPYFNPHSLRNTLVQLAYELKLDETSLNNFDRSPSLPSSKISKQSSHRRSVTG